MLCDICSDAYTTALRQLMQRGKPCDLRTVVALASSYDLCESCDVDGYTLLAFVNAHPELGVAHYFDGTQTIYFPAPPLICPPSPPRSRYAI